MTDRRTDPSLQDLPRGLLIGAGALLAVASVTGLAGFAMSGAANPLNALLFSNMIILSPVSLRLALYLWFLNSVFWKCNSDKNYQQPF